MLPIRNKVAIVGVGWSKISRHADTSLGALTIEACSKAVEDAGLKLSDIDGLSTYSNPSRVGASETPGIDFVPATFVARVLRMHHLRYHSDVTQGTVILALINAVNSVASGASNYALVWRSMHNPPGYHNVSPVTRAGGDAQFSLPYGQSGPGQFSLPYSSYMARYGATREHMATLIVNSRKNGAMNPHSVFYRQPITRQDYLDSRMIAEPLCLLDCDMYVDGSAAVVVTTAERARVLKQKPAYVTGFGQSMSFDHGAVRTLESIRENAGLLARTLWANSGMTAADIDQPNVYDGYSPFVYFWLEALGFCKDGEAFEFIQDGRIEIGGKTPVNTAGGNLGVGRMHGMPHLSDAVYQVQGRAGPRQVQNARTSLAVVGTPQMASGVVLSGDGGA